VHLQAQVILMEVRVGHGLPAENYWVVDNLYSI